MGSVTGTIFDIKQFAVFDGPGIRTTVFLKGCPLHCMWCHNPEGLSFEPQLMVSHNSCVHCGKCREVCKHPDQCILCGDCIRVCPDRLRKICGQRMTAQELAAKLLKDREYLTSQGGGVTFSGGEPCSQPEFLLECLDLLEPMHCSIETSGYCAPGVFRKIIEKLDHIIMDIKMVEEKEHIYYTGVSNRQILENLEQLKKSGKPFRIRIPVIPGVNDSEDNFEKTAGLLKDCESLEMVELLPYHKTAGAKYEMVGRTYEPEFDIDQAPNINKKPFLKAGICCKNM